MTEINHWVQSFNQIVHGLRLHSLEALLFTCALWGAHLINVLTGMRLVALGIRPRDPIGLIGIFFAPFIHGNWSHLFFNSIPFFLLTLLLLSSYPEHTAVHSYLTVSATIILFSGLANWLFARSGIHLGASGVIMGLWGFILFKSYFLPGAHTIIIAIICLYYLGGMATHLIYAEEGVSLEGHVLGFLSGVLTSHLS